MIHLGKNAKLCTLLGKVGYASMQSIRGEKSKRYFYEAKLRVNAMKNKRKVLLGGTYYYSY